MSLRPPLPPPPVLALLLALLLVHPLRAQTEPTLRIPTDSVSIGEPFELVLTVPHNAMTRLIVPDPARGDSVFGDLEVLALADSSHRYGGTARPGLRVDSIVYRVVTFALDTAFVPPLPVRLVRPGDTLMALTGSAEVPVRSLVPSDAEALRDMAPPEAFDTPAWAWALLAGAALALAVALALLLRRRRGPAETPAPPPEPDHPPYQVALERLEALRAMDLDDDAQVKAFYVELSDLLRTYLERRAGLPALEETTAELVRDLRRLAEARRLPGDLPERTRRLLSGADLVKFADARPAPSERRDALDETRALLDAAEDALRPREPAEEPA